MTSPGASGVAAGSSVRAFWERHRARWTLPLVIIVIIALVAVIDHLASHRISQVDRPQPSVLIAAPGGSSTVVLNSPWDGFNPNTSGGASSSSAALLSSVLPGAYVLPPKLVPIVDSSLLTSVEITSTSPLVIQYVINPKAVWSDGVPVTAQDFIYAWHAQRGDGVDIDGQPDDVASTLGYRDIASIKTSQHDRVLSVAFSTPYADWRALFDHLVPAHIADKVGWNAGFATFNPKIDLSAGPYMVESAQGDTKAVLVRNPRWWGTPGLLDRITVVVATSDTSWASILAATNLNSLNPSSFTLHALNAISSLPNTQSSVHSDINFYSLEFNLNSALLTKASVREGIAHVVDRPSLLAATFGAVNPSLAVNDDHLAVSGEPNYTGSTAASDYDTPDLSTSDALLRLSGYHTRPDDTYVDAADHPLVLRMAVELGDPWIQGVANLLQSQFEADGIGIVQVPVQGPRGLAAANFAGAYDLALALRQGTPYMTQTAAWYSSKDTLQGSSQPQNWSNVDDPQINALFAHAATVLNPVTAELTYAQIDDELWDQMIALPLFGQPGFQANGVQLANASFNPSSDGTLWNAALWTRMVPGPTSTTTTLGN